MFRLQSSRTENLISRAENLLCALFGDGVGVVTETAIEPMLYIAAGVVGAFEVQSFGAKLGDRFRFDFAQVLRRSFCVGKICFDNVP